MIMTSSIFPITPDVAFLSLAGRSPKKLPLSAVMLYPETKELRRDKSWRSQLRDTQIMFRSVSDDDFYKAADLNFIQAKVDSNFAIVAQKYNVKDVPKFLLFQGREPMYGTLAGFIYRDQLQNFINRNLKTELVGMTKRFTLSCSLPNRPTSSFQATPA